ncbi:MFS transporter [Kitasatospora sp. NPDC008115]|uniref:MFS transporter n=1 Tax=Kitasatospora sp. NPDC008115 TaxID=3364022 RepID=UPI0036DFFF8F
MTQTPPVATAPADGPADAGTGPARSPRRLGPVLATTHLSWILPATGVATLTQARLGELGDAEKLTRFTVIAVAGSSTALIANIAFGLISDRTRSRHGRRNPWILAGAAASATAVSAMSFTGSFPVLLALAVVYQVALNAMLSPLFAVLPDRVAPERMGRASSWVGLGQLLGQSIGGASAGLLVTEPQLGMRWLPWITVLGGLLFFTTARDTPSTALPKEPFSWRAIGRSLLPPKDADYFWALGGRMVALLGFYLVLVYQLYVLTDHLGLSTDESGPVIALGGVLMAVSSATSIAVCGPLSDRTGRRKPFIIAATAVCAAAVVPLVLTTSIWAFYTFILVGGLGYGCLIAVDQAVVSEVLPDQEHRAKDLGFLNIANTMPGLIAPLIAGLIVPAFGYPALFCVAIVLTLTGGLLILPIRRVA